MPDHFYTGPSGRYPVLRDTAGQLAGDVEPGDIRDFEEPPDVHWLPVAGNEDHVLLAPPAAEPPGEPGGETKPPGRSPKRTADPAVSSVTVPAQTTEEPK